ncbi:Lar family restriction alleviation protein [Pseudomonas putida]|uniref:Restriction alleviation protein, Lar family n=1 Tax=Pseudomonas putida TaxID=303 RepID=A0A1Q9R391_PSEPU|nr:Lar family restriction alleviation protein [Pseudomonas putida]OLS61851.1 hypothetical protein PSEMO_32240 [Pseudomonas putida]
MPTENRSSNTETTSELLPCPFCGQQDFLIERLDLDASVVICQGLTGPNEACLARGPVGVVQDEGEDQPGRDKAVELWNARAEQLQGEPVALPERKRETLNGGAGYRGLGNAEGWNACLDEIAKLGPLYTHADAGEVERLRFDLAEMTKSYEALGELYAGTQKGFERLQAKLAERDAHPMHALGQEAYSTLVGMVEHCLNQRFCMGMDEGFKSFDPEDEHDFVKELHAFVALSASAEPSAPKCETCQDHGVIGWQTGQTPETFDQGDAPCPDCAPVERDERAAYDAWRHSQSGYVRHFNRHEWSAWQARAALERKPS